MLLEGTQHTPSAQLLAWINTHDCGVHPTAIRAPDGSIEIRVEGVNTTDNSLFIESTFVRTYAEARDALGY